MKFVIFVLSLHTCALVYLNIPAHSGEKKADDNDDSMHLADATVLLLLLLLTVRFECVEMLIGRRSVLFNFNDVLIREISRDRLASKRTSLIVVSLSLFIEVIFELSQSADWVCRSLPLVTWNEKQSIGHAPNAHT